MFNETECVFENFAEQDFARSGISKDVYYVYKNNGFINLENDGYKIIYPDLMQNVKTEYFNKRLQNPTSGSKYIKPKGQSSRLFRPLGLDLSSLYNSDDWLIITEGEKKAIKAVQEGFNCIALSGVWCWKQNPQNSDSDSEIEDIIPDVLNMKAKKIVLCFDSDMWEKAAVKQALYSFAAYLIGERGIRVKILILPHGNAKGLDDYLIEFGNQAFQEILDKTEQITLKEIQNILRGNAGNKLKFPIQVFDDKVKDFIISTSQNMDAPPEYLASAFLIGASSLMDGHYRILVNPSSNWIEYPILWGAIVGGPSQKKTPSINVVRKIIANIEQILQEEYEKEYQAYKQKYDEYKIQKEQLKKSKSKELAFLEEPVKPFPMVITAQDTTKEALANLVKNNKGRGISIFVDELASFLKSFGQYKNGNGADEEYFLQAWIKQTYRVTRKSSEENFIINPSHNIIGTIQPKVLEKTLFKDGFDTTNGMIERWLFICTDYEETGILPQSKFPFDNNVIKGIYSRLYELEVEQDYYFSDSAKELFINFVREIADRKKKLNLTDLTKNYLQKQTNYVARFALILHCIENNELYEISHTTLQNAIELSNYFIKSFERVANISMDNNSHTLLNSALNYIKTKELNSISPSQLHRSNVSKYRKLEDAKTVLTTLADFGYGRMCKGKKKGTSFIFYRNL